LLTLKAVRALGSADIALVDDLVNREVLQFLRADARMIAVGKRGGCRSTPQAFIERQMVRFSRAGQCVARVKGGDPFVFGRGAEEAEALRAAGVAVEIVSGITAGIGVPATIGIPLTHRELAHGATFITGHPRAGATVDWRALVASGTTLVVYMGIAQLPRIVADLRAAGMAADTPVAVIQNGTLPHERSVVTCLGTVVSEVTRSGIGSPALVVIGKVVNLATVARSARTRLQAA
jgi:uroporphyrin-III C-methyltransferase